MSIRYDRARDELRKSGKKVGRRSKNWAKIATDWVASEIGLGKSLSQICWDKSEVLPSFAEIIQMRNENPDIAVKLQQAESVRLKRVQENFIEIINRVYETGASEDIELLKGMGQQVDRLIKSTGASAASIHFAQVFPDDFWDTPVEELELEVKEGFLDNK